MEALAARHDAAVQMIDTSVVRVHQHGAWIADHNHQDNRSLFSPEFAPPADLDWRLMWVGNGRWRHP
jgi:hypothetical protein